MSVAAIDAPTLFVKHEDIDEVRVGIDLLSKVHAAAATDDAIADRYPCSVFLYGGL